MAPLNLGILASAGVPSLSMSISISTIDATSFSGDYIGPFLNGSATSNKSDEFITTQRIYTDAGLEKSVVTKTGIDGSHIYSTNIEDSDSLYQYGAAGHSDGGVVIVGQNKETNPDYAFLTKLDASGSEVYTKRKADASEASSIFIDESNGLMVSGAEFTGTGSSGRNLMISAHNYSNGSDVFNRVFSVNDGNDYLEGHGVTKIGGTGDYVVVGHSWNAAKVFIRVDASGNVPSTSVPYVRPNNNASSRHRNLLSDSSGNVYLCNDYGEIIKLDSNLSYVADIKIDPISDASGYKIDSDGNIYFIADNDGEAKIIKVDSNLNIVFARSIGLPNYLEYAGYFSHNDGGTMGDYFVATLMAYSSANDYKSVQIVMDKDGSFQGDLTVGSDTFTIGNTTVTSTSYGVTTGTLDLVTDFSTSSWNDFTGLQSITDVTSSVQFANSLV